tara:strand:- start:643 stop:1587 length:945 start_codon:yes stop_codon:yes gene_type:complete
MGWIALVGSAWMNPWDNPPWFDGGYKIEVAHRRCDEGRVKEKSSRVGGLDGVLAPFVVLGLVSYFIQSPMKISLITSLALFSILLAGNAVSQEKKYVPEDGSAELVKKKRGKKASPIDPSLPNVLIIGDSISMGYTSKVIEAMAGKANVMHSPGNSQGTTNGLANIDSWLEPMKWDVIHFNFGLHDLKRVTEAGTSSNSNDPDDPYQADAKTYAANLKEIVVRLKKTEATLIFATTTPFPAGVKPFRSPDDAGNYNTAALKIMKKNGIEVNDLYALVLPDLATLQKPVNVHFQAEGSQIMADAVAKRIGQSLDK